MTWRDEIRTCERCETRFTPSRRWQRFCKKTCGAANRVNKHRRGKGKKWRYKEKATPVAEMALQALTRRPDASTRDAEQIRYRLGDGPTMVWPVKDDQPWPTPGALQGDDVQLEYYEDGYPKLPACLDRRRMHEPLAEAA